MALFNSHVVTTSDTLDFVYSWDPCVTAPAGEVGWLPKDLCTIATVDGHVADVVTVRGLNVVEAVAAEDAGGVRSRSLAMCRRAVVAVNGRKSREVIDAWLDTVALFNAGSALTLLGLVVSALTRGGDHRRAQRAALDKLDETTPEGD